VQRRQFVKTGGALLTAGMVGLSGCGGVFGGGDDTSTGSFGDVTDWTPAPALLGSDLTYRFNASSPSQLAGVSDNPTWQSAFAQQTAFGRLPAEDVEYTVRAGVPERLPEGRSFRVYVGDFDSAWIGTKLQRTENDSVTFDPDTPIDEYDVYTAETRAFAVSGDAIVDARHGSPPGDEDPDPADFAETIIDTNTGDADSYAAGEDMGMLADAVPDGHVFQAETFEQIGSEDAVPETGDFENLVGEAQSLTVQGSMADISRLLVFFAERAVDEDAIETYIEESSEFNAYQERPEYEVTGRTVEITGTSNLGNFSTLFPGT
jgi:hypothetical protein